MPGRLSLLQAVLDSSREGIAVFKGKELYASNARARVLFHQASALSSPEGSGTHLPDITHPEAQVLPAAISQLAADVISSGTPQEATLDVQNLSIKGTPFVEPSGEAFAIISIDETSPHEASRLWNALADKRQWAALFAEHWPMSFLCCEWSEEAQEFTYLAVNDACLKAFGLKHHSDIVGKTTTEFGRTKQEVVGWAELIRAIPQGKCTPVEIPTTTPDGKPCIILNTGIRCSSPGNPHNFRFFHSLEDVTERRRTESLLQEERTKLCRTVEELQVLKLLFDRSPLAMGLVELTTDMTDMRFLTLVEKSIQASIGTSERSEGKWFLSQCLRTASTNTQFLTLACKAAENNECFDEEFSSTSGLYWKFYFVPLGFNRVGYMGRDITHQKKLEAMMRRQGEELEKAVQERTRDLEEALQVKNRFLAVVSHEIRTPIAGVLGSMELLSETELSEDQLPLLRTARTCGEQLSTVIDDILDLTKIQDKRILLSNEEFCFIELLEDLMDITVFSLNRRKIELILDFDETAPSWLVGDVSRLRQILINILSNAVKFTEAGEVVVSVSTEPPTPEQATCGQRIVSVRVRDTGTGIQESVHSKIFQPFSQADSSVNRRFGGSGLGLSISKNLAQLMGGDLTFESNPSVRPGTTFMLRFPAVVRCVPVQPLPLRPRVVVVEPCETLRTVLLTRLNALACEVLAFDSLAACLPVLQNAMPAPSPPAAGCEEAPLPVPGKRKADDYDATTSRDKSPSPPPEQPVVLFIDHATDAQCLSQVQSAVPWLKVVFMGYNAVQLTAPFLNKPIRRASLRSAVMAAADLVDIPRSQRRVTRRLTERTEAMPGMKIMVAEDNPSNQLIIRKYLENLGYPEVKLVENGRQALEEALSTPYDVILMDLMMPIMSGLEASEKIRASLPPERRPYVVALTASAFEEDKQKCLRAGMHAVLTKPLNRSQLEQLLKQRLIECNSRKLAPS